MFWLREKNWKNLVGSWVIAVFLSFPMVTTLADKATEVAAKEATAELARLRGTVFNKAGQALEGARVRIAIPATDMRFVNLSTGQRLIETTTNANGDFFFRVKTDKPTMVSFDAMLPGYRRLVGTMMSGGDAKSVTITPNKTVTADLVLNPAGYFAGTVVDKSGEPISNVRVSAIASFARSSGGVEQTATGKDGSFELFNYPKEANQFANQKALGLVAFEHPNYIPSRIDDVYELLDEERTSLQIVLDAGIRVDGVLLDREGRPAANQQVKIASPNNANHKYAATDKRGRFDLRGLIDGPLVFSALDVANNQKVTLAIAQGEPKRDLEIQMKPIRMPQLKTYSVLGMKLIDVNPDVKRAYNLFFENGAMILDPGEDSDRLMIGKLKPGNNFWMVGQRRIRTVREFVTELLEESKLQKSSPARVRVVYHFAKGSNTQYIRLTEADLKSLREIFDTEKTK